MIAKLYFPHFKKSEIFVLSVLTFVVFISLETLAQDTIFIMNPSFEGVPKKGGLLSKEEQSKISSKKNKLYTSFDMEGWKDCGCEYCTPPDIHPDSFWGNTLEPADGKTYLGLVARDNDTFEAVGQELSAPLLPGICYCMDIYVAKAENYWSNSPTTGVKMNFNSSLVLELFGGDDLCSEKSLLTTSSLIRNSEWNQIKMCFKPKDKMNYLTIQARWKRPFLQSYNGNVLIDGMSHIYSVDCE
jgi:hypothetical protein